MIFLFQAVRTSSLPDKPPGTTGLIPTRTMGGSCRNPTRTSSYRTPVSSPLSNTSDDRRPSLAELQKEDRYRRPSVTEYQLVDSNHPDLTDIQKLVEKMHFGEYDK
ncbi:uncharacterized protein LOC111712324 [Eurytemora carolleeae]|uniref:uncharacterized protein LOC111712324 n=1 Tax=Eurytemora carolleeae TaxID=1294199 RepID=UPI000C76F7F4|nr:uncharacterized protein LOC111712324 [Eurytemora carolleeae]|eukprot:XP_023342666.1 uncharacterized protein LOC111712324 [Eurytemora affinis]